MTHQQRHEDQHSTECHLGSTYRAALSGIWIIAYSICKLLIALIVVAVALIATVIAIAIVISIATVIVIASHAHADQPPTQMIDCSRNDVSKLAFGTLRT